MISLFSQKKKKPALKGVKLKCKCGKTVSGIEAYEKHTAKCGKAGK